MECRVMKKDSKMNVKKGLLIVIVLILIMMWGIGVYRVNTQIPQVKKSVFQSGEWIPWKDGMEIKVQGMHFMEDDEIRKNGRIPEESLYSYEMRLLWAEICVRNRGEKESLFDALDLGAESDGWSNIPDVEFYQYFCDAEKGLYNNLQPGEEMTYELPYLLLRANFRDSEWEKAEQKQYYITWSLYPEKLSVSIP